MNKTQICGFILTGIVFIICGSVMGLLGNSYNASPLIWLCPVFILSGLFWMIIGSIIIQKRQRSDRN